MMLQGKKKKDKKKTNELVNRKENFGMLVHHRWKVKMQNFAKTWINSPAPSCGTFSSPFFLLSTYVSYSIASVSLFYIALKQE